MVCPNAVYSRDVRRRRRAAAADRISASRRRRFRDVFMLLDFCNAIYNEAWILTKSRKNDAGVFCKALDTHRKHGGVKAKCFHGQIFFVKMKADAKSFV